MKMNSVPPIEDGKNQWIIGISLLIIMPIISYILYYSNPLELIFNHPIGLISDQSAEYYGSIGLYCEDVSLNINKYQISSNKCF